MWRAGGEGAERFEYGERIGSGGRMSVFNRMRWTPADIRCTLAAGTARGRSARAHPYRRSRALAEETAWTTTPPPTQRTACRRIFNRRAGFTANLSSRLVAFIDATRETLDCAIYDLRHPEVLAALKRLIECGKTLRLVYDASGDQFGDQSVDPKPSGTEAALSEAGLRDYATTVRRDKHLMHDKFLVRDAGENEAAVWTGSANFTVGGLESQDNTCLVLGSKALAARYRAVFAELLAAGTPPPAATAAMAGAAEVTADHDESGVSAEAAAGDASMGARNKPTARCQSPSATSPSRRHSRPARARASSGPSSPRCVVRARSV